MNKWSYSRLKSAECPYRYWSHYIAGNHAASSAAAQPGQLCHEAAENYARHCRSLGDPGATSDIEYGARLLLRLRDEDPEAADAFGRFLSFVSFNWSELYARGEDVELWLEADLPDGLGRFRGRIDRCSVAVNARRATIVDYKFTRFVSAEEQKGPPPVQLLCYAWLLGKQPEFVARPLEYFDLQICYARAHRTHDWEEVPWAQVEQVEGWLTDKVRDLRDRETALSAALATLEDASSEDLVLRHFPTRPHPRRCALCGHVQHCPLVRAGAVDAITNADEAKMLAQSLIAAEEATARSRALLREWVKEHGPVPLDERTQWGAATRTRLHVKDVGAFIERFRDHGEQLQQWLHDALGPKGKHTEALLREVKKLRNEPWRAFAPNYRALATRLQTDTSASVLELADLCEECETVRWGVHETPEMDFDDEQPVPTVGLQYNEAGELVETPVA